ncbi:MAG TPA: hypothetical protein VKP30_13800 [Polyangiaceae bacterium]|nr:hypothetical protein [Polyangiaceae bacterium]
MNEPRRLICDGKRLDGRLLRTTLKEPVPRGSLDRAAQRLGFSAAFLSSITTGLANAASVEAIASGAVVTTKASFASAGLVVLTKGVGVGLLVGAVAVGSVHVAFPPSEPNRDVALPSRTLPSRTNDTVYRRPVGSLAPLPVIAPEASTTPPSEVQNVILTGVRSTKASTMEPVRSTAPSIRTAQESWVSVPVDPGASALPQADPASILQREVSVLDQARAALKAGNALRSLAILDRAQHREPLRALDKEAKLVRVEALAASGRTAEAADLAAELISQGVSVPQRTKLSRWVQR